MTDRLQFRIGETASAVSSLVQIRVHYGKSVRLTRGEETAVLPRTTVLLLSVILWARSDAVLAAPPAKEIEWLPVRELVAEATTVELDLLPEAQGTVDAGPRPVVCVRGVFPVEAQRKLVVEMQRRLPPRPANSAVSPVLKPDPPTIIDFTIERQVLDRTERQVFDRGFVPDGSASQGEQLSRKTALGILEVVRDYMPDVVAEKQVSPLITMPLPTRSEGTWGAEVGHPLLKDADQDGLLFRYLDFDVQPGKFYRYRVKLKVVNPLYGSQAEDPFVSHGVTRDSPWSQPSGGVRVAAAK